jgi:hypothetical protein
MRHIAGVDVCYHPGVVDEVAHGMVADLITPKGAPMRWWMGWCLGILQCTARIGDTDERQGSSFPSDEYWEGYRSGAPSMISGGEGSRYPTTSPSISQVKARFSVYAMDAVARIHYIQPKTSVQDVAQGIE